MLTLLSRVLLCLASLVSVGACGSTDEAAPAPWLQLERYTGPGQDLVIWVEGDGSYSGHFRTTAIAGRLPETDVAILLGLFDEGQLPLYARDALPTSMDPPLGGAADRPVYRIVVRKNVPPIVAGQEKMVAYFHRGGGKEETEKMLSEVARIVNALEISRP